MESRKSFVSRKKVYVLCVLLAVVLLVFAVKVDRYWLRGRVVQSSDGVAISSANILVTIRGGRPYVPVPHSRRRTSLCIGTFAVVADEDGFFELSRINVDGPFINKHVTFAVFAEGWMSDIRIEPIRSNMFGPPQFFEFVLEPESMKRLGYHGHETYDEQMTRSVGFDSLERMFQPVVKCDANAVPVLVKVVHRMAKISESEEERRLTLAYCRRLVESGADSLVCDESLFSGGNDVD